jgi:hypothetical protein
MLLPVKDVKAFAKGSRMTFSKPSLLVTSLSTSEAVFVSFSNVEMLVASGKKISS